MLSNYHSMLMQLSKTMWYKSAITSDIYFFVVSEQWQYLVTYINYVLWIHCGRVLIILCKWTAWELYQCADSKAIINLIVQKDKWSFVWGFKVLFAVATQWNFGSFGQIGKISFVLKIQTERSFWWVAEILQHWRATIYSLFISHPNFVSLINSHINYNSSYSCNISTKWNKILLFQFSFLFT